jgi:uroporphyrinogen-III synthase
MTADNIAQSEVLKEVKSILISQPKPLQKSPYYDLEQKYGLQIDFRSFIQVEAVAAKEFRKQKIYPEEYSSVILSSKNAVDHFFRLCEELRIKVNPDTKYFCLTENIANYLQKFILFRKRKVFNGTKVIQDLAPYFQKHKDKETFLFPCSNLGSPEITVYLKEANIPYQEALMYRTISSDLSDLTDITYDVLVFFSALDIKSLYDNFPDFKQNETRIAVFGNTTTKAVLERGLDVNIMAPTPDIPSMPMALERYLQLSNR